MKLLYTGLYVSFIHKDINMIGKIFRCVDNVADIYLVEPIHKDPTHAELITLYGSKLTPIEDSTAALLYGR